MYEASARDFRIVLATDAVSGLYDRGLDEVHRIGVHCMSTLEVCSAIRRIARGTGATSA